MTPASHEQQPAHGHGAGSERVLAARARHPEHTDPRPLVWWGMLLLAAVLVTSYVALAFVAVYIRIASGPWPPSGIAPPALALPGLAVLTLLVSLAAVATAARGHAAGHLWGARSLLTAAILLAGLHGALLLADWAGQPFAVDAHAYASLYFVLPGIHLVLVALGMLIAGVLLALTWHPAGGPRVFIGALVLRLYWTVIALGGAALLAVVYLLPHVWQEALVP